MCWTPFLKRQPLKRAQRCCVLNGQSKLFERIGSGTLTSMPPILSISLLKLWKLTITTWLIGRPV